jgi:hypothetical protein
MAADDLLYARGGIECRFDPFPSETFDTGHATSYGTDAPSRCQDTGTSWPIRNNRGFDASVG